VGDGTPDVRLRQVVDASRDPYLQIDGAGLVTEWNRAAEELLGWSRADVVGRPLEQVVTRRFHDVLRQGLEVLRAETDAGRREWAPVVIEMELLRRDGEAVLASGAVFVVGSGNDFGVAGFVHAADLPQRAVSRDRLHDLLTGLPNRALFSRRLAVALEESRSSGGSVAVAVIDIDRFKAINDALGHDTGDELLVAITARLRQVAEHAILLARLGGDEFLALFAGPRNRAHDLAVDFAERVIDTLADPFDLTVTEAFVTASVGIAVSTAGADEAMTLLSNADAAMHETKAEGGGKHKVFGEAMRRQVVERLSTEHALHRALDRRELTLYYQPVVDISGSTAVGVEALIRWAHPEQGLMAPARFIPVAEESGLIIPIGAWVIEEACRQLRSWREGGKSGPDGSVEVNLSARQVDDPQLVATVESILELTGLPPANLTLEITESALMRDAVAALDVLRALKSVGVALAIDDFGTGYSSLSHLQRFPLDILKVDKSFVDELDQGQGIEIVGAVIDLAHALDLKVVAEGVETERQLAVLREMRCDFAQGYLFARPVPAAELTGLRLGA
jgi:diguanylate cyclase (GGDEF)-like protein/PAS domain S-box-containing protein